MRAICMLKIQYYKKMARKSQSSHVRAGCMVLGPQIAIWGTPFCESAIRGLKLAVQNLGRLSFVTIMSKLLIVLGKVQIAMVAPSPPFSIWRFPVYIKIKNLTMHLARI